VLSRDAEIHELSGGRIESIRGERNSSTTPVALRGTLAAATPFRLNAFAESGVSCHVAKASGASGDGLHRQGCAQQARFSCGPAAAEKKADIEHYAVTHGAQARECEQISVL